MQQVVPRASFNRRYAVTPRRSLQGLSDAGTAQGVQQVGSIATPAVTGIIAAHAASVAAATGVPLSSVSLLGMSAGVAIPVIGAALVGATILAAWLIKNSGCGQTCVVTSQWANQAEAMLKQNIAAYFAIPAPRPRAAQTVALANFDAVWHTLIEQCGQPSVGDAGKACISDRQAGACKWKQTGDSPLLAYPGEPQPGECWNWFLGYRNPIANDTNVIDVPTTTAEDALGSTISTIGTSIGSSPLLPVVALGLLGLALFGGKD